jgi:UDP-3-O-[3-hydroxymyristoyl] glucosamine N-acyltransferase
MITAGEAAELTGAVITGPADTVIHRLAKIEDAGSGDLSFLERDIYAKFYGTTKASVLFVKPGFNKSRSEITYLEVKNPYLSFVAVLNRYFAPEFRLTGISPSAYIDPTAKIGTNCAIGQNVVIEANCMIGDNAKIFHNTVISRDTKIGNNALIFQNVSIREECIIGDNVIIHPGAVVGSDGFGFVRDSAGVYNKVWQKGNVIIEDDVELGSNVCIDRAAMGSTIIRKGVKMDNLIQIAHGAEIGENSVLSALSGVAGSSILGKNCIVAAQVGIADHLRVTDGAIILAQSGVSRSIDKPGMYFGYPAKEHRLAQRLEVHTRNLPEYADRIKALEKKIAELEEKSGSK